MSDSKPAKMPVMYVPHAGGSFSYVDLGVDPQAIGPVVAYWKKLVDEAPTRPKALLIVSAHWEAPTWTVMTAPKPPMLYDYYGFPKADIPAGQLSLKVGLDPKEHLALGRALQPLRDEGVLILGSGMSDHNLRMMRSPAADKDAAAFDGWLQAVTLMAPADRDRALAAWDEAPSARAVHPREEHLLPLMVVAGAAGDSAARIAFSGPIMGKPVTGIHFG